MAPGSDTTVLPSRGAVIETIETVNVAIPAAKPFVWGPGWSITTAEYVIVRITTDAGITGIGESAPSMTSLGDTPAAVAEVIHDELAPRLLGMELLGLGDLGMRFSDVARCYGAKASVEFALLDAIARTLQAPLWRLLGGARREVPLVWMASAGRREEVVEELMAAHERGFQWFKLKVESDVAAAVKLTRAARQSLPAAHIYVDPNLQLRGHAYVAFTDACRELQLEFMEEPLPWRNNPARAALFAQGALPVLADESVETVARAIPEIEAGPAQLISLKPPRLGVAATRFLADLCAAHQKQPWVGSHAETDLGALSCAHLVGGFGPLTGPSELAFYQRLSGSLLAGQIDRGGAVIQLSDAPGLGIELDEDALAHWCVTRRRTNRGKPTH